MKTLLWICLAAAPARAETAQAQKLLEQGRALYFSGKLTRASETFQKAARFPSHSLPALLDYAAVQRELGKTEEAVRALESASALDPLDPEIAVELGWLYYFSARPEKARDRFEAALKLSSGHPRAQLGLASSLLESEKAREALEALNNLKAVLPTYALADYLLGKSYSLLDDHRQAAEMYLQTMRRDWTFAESRLPLAEAHLKLENPVSAWRQYAKMLEWDRGHRFALEMAEKLKARIDESSRQLPPPPAITVPTPIDAVLEPEKIPRLRVGIGTDAIGVPQKRERLLLWSGGPLRLTGTKTGKIYAESGKDETWEVRYKPADQRVASPHCVVVTPQGELGPFVHPVQIEPVWSSSHTVILHEISYQDAIGRTTPLRKEFRGALILAPHRKWGLVPVNALNEEEYLMGVLPAEVPKTWPMEALKAQAVIARTYILYRQRFTRPHGGLYDLCDGQHCQVYSGVQAEGARTNQAARETRGMLLYYKDSLARTFYHSTCGGRTQNSSWIGWGNWPYLVSVLDGDPSAVSPPASPWEILLWIKGFPEAYCRGGQYSSLSEFRWVRVISHRDLEDRLNRIHRVGKLRSLLSVQRSPSGNVRELWITGSKRKKVVKKENLIRHNLGSLRGTLFLIETKKDAKGNPLEYWIHGGGWGHGIGLCQTGSAALAGKHGKNFEQILAHYYPGTRIHRLEY